MRIEACQPCGKRARSQIAMKWLRKRSARRTPGAGGVEAMSLTKCVLARPKPGGFPNRSSLVILSEVGRIFFPFFWGVAERYPRFEFICWGIGMFQMYVLKGIAMILDSTGIRAPNQI